MVRNSGGEAVKHASGSNAELLQAARPLAEQAERQAEQQIWILAQRRTSWHCSSASAAWARPRAPECWASTGSTPLLQPASRLALCPIHPCAADTHPPARICPCLPADNWSVKAVGRKTTGTGRMKHLKLVQRRFKNGFREGEPAGVGWGDGQHWAAAGGW